jgi:hypothetical protein
MYAFITFLAWKISEASAVLSGMGYGKDSAGGDTFSYAENVDIIGMSSSILIYL